MSTQHFWILNQDTSRSRPILTIIGSGFRTVWATQTESGYLLNEPVHDVTEEVTTLEWQQIPHIPVEGNPPFGEVIAALRTYRPNLTE